MGKQGVVGDRLRERLRAERERVGWSQAEVAARLMDRRWKRGVYTVYPSTVAKIEAGERAVRADELSALADLFHLPVDVLLGRGSNGADALGAATKLTSAAQKMAGEVRALRDRLAADTEDLNNAAERDERLQSARLVIDAAADAYAQLDTAQKALSVVASQFPLPGKMP